MRILYICTGNCFRSPVAEALTRRYRPELEVESAGVRPGSRIPENARDFLRGEGALEYLKPGPEPVSQRAIEEADLIVVMEPSHEDYLSQNFDIDGKEMRCWDIKDPILPDVSSERAFEEIRERVEGL